MSKDNFTFTIRRYDGEAWIRATDVANYMTLKGEQKEEVEKILNYEVKCGALQKELPEKIVGAIVVKDGNHKLFADILKNQNQLIDYLGDK